MNGESLSCSDKLKDAIPFVDLETAKAIKKHIESIKKENFEVVSVVTTITVIEESKNETYNPEIEEE